jgi:hypothetical protein
MWRLLSFVEHYVTLAKKIRAGGNIPERPATSILGIQILNAYQRSKFPAQAAA